MLASTQRRREKRKKKRNVEPNILPFDGWNFMFCDPMISEFSLVENTLTERNNMHSLGLFKRNGSTNGGQC